MTLPFRDPDNELSLNIAIVLLIIAVLGKTPRGKLLLNNERLLTCKYLLKNPLVLNKILAVCDKPRVSLRPHDEYSIASISMNSDSLHDGRKLKFLLQHAAALGLIKVSYRKVDGFLYDLSQEGLALTKELKGDYFESLNSYAEALIQLNSMATAKLNGLVESDRWEAIRESK